MLSFPLTGWLTRLLNTHTQWPGIAWVLDQQPPGVVEFTWTRIVRNHG